MNVVLRAAVCALWCVVVGVAQNDRAASRPYDAALAAAGVTVESAPALIVAAKAAFEAGDARLAAALLDVAATRTADSRPVKLDAARARLAAGEPAVALRAAEALQKSAPWDTDVAVVRAQALIDLGEPAMARDVLAPLARTLTLHGPTADAWFALEVAYGDLGLAESVARCMKGKPLGELTASQAAALAAGYAREGRHLDAFALAQKVLERRGPQSGSGATDVEVRAAARDAVRSALVLEVGESAMKAAHVLVPKGVWREASDEDVVLFARAMRAGFQGKKADEIARAASDERPRSAALRIAAAEADVRDGDQHGAARRLARGFDLADDPTALRTAFDRLTASLAATDSAAESSFSLDPAGLRAGDETLPLGAPASSVRLRQLRVAAGSPRAALTIAAGHLSAEDLRRALDALAGAGFTRVRFP